MRNRLLILFILAIAVLSATAEDLNPFAYKLGATYDNSTNSVAISYTLNAPANMVQIVIYQDENNPAKIQDFAGVDYTTAGNHTAVVSLHGLAGGDYSYKINVYGKGLASNTAFHKHTVLNSPFSIDIDNNMNSPYFGRTMVTQPTTNALRGLYEYWPVYFTLGTAPDNPYNGGTGNYYQGSESWYYQSHATPLRVRIAQDGSGRIFTTACDVDMNTYLWYVDPANPHQWTSILTAQQMKNIVSYPGTGNIHNASLDIRIEDGRINLLLLSASLKNELTNNTFITGYIYSGKYVLPANFPESTQGEYIHIIYPEAEKGFIGPHQHIKSGLLSVAINCSSQFDKYGGYWYFGTTQSDDKDSDGVAYKNKSALMHITNEALDPDKPVDANNVKCDYHNNDEYLKRYYTGTGGFRSSRDFNQVVVANGYRKTARLYSLSQNSVDVHPSLSLIDELGTITSLTGNSGNYITDFAWDHANNIYVVLRNGSTGYGIYTYATKYDKNVPFVTKAPDGVTFNIACDDNVSYTLTTSVNDANMGTVTAGGTHKSCSAVTLTATPKSGYRFVNWTLNGEDVGAGTKNQNDDNYTYTVYMTDHVNVCANFASAVYTGITWWNLFKDGEDIYDAEIDTKRNARLYYLFMAYYNAGSGDGLRWAAKMADSSGEYNLVNSCYVYADELLNENSSAPMYWLGEYIKSVVGEAYTFEVAGDNNQTANTRWGQALYAMINRVGYAKSPSSPYSKYTTPEGLMNAIKAFAPISSGGEGKGEYTEWRPWWTNLSCGLPNSLKYNDALPVEWTMQSAPYNSYDTYENNTVPGNYQPNKTPKWYKWNIAPDGKTYDQSQYLLAWRDGADGPIVHHASRSNMALYATYVDKNLQEEDPDPQSQYDAKNDDIRQLLANSNYGASMLHGISVDRKFAAGMYNTICLPFDVYADKMPSEFEGAEIKKFSGVEQTYDEVGDPVAVLNFEDATPTTSNILLEAGKPYLIKPQMDINGPYLLFEDIKCWSVKGTGGAYGETHDGIIFQGVFNPTTLPAGSLILVADNRLAQVQDVSEKMKGFRAYFFINDAYLQGLADEGRVYMNFKKPTTTSIPVAPEAEQQTKPEVRKVMYDGNIYILRGDEVYTITGNRVK